jgi:hypothetical protein
MPYYLLELVKRNYRQGAESNEKSLYFQCETEFANLHQFWSSGTVSLEVSLIQLSVRGSGKYLHYFGNGEYEANDKKKDKGIKYKSLDAMQMYTLRDMINTIVESDARLQELQRHRDRIIQNIRDEEARAHHGGVRNFNTMFELIPLKRRKRRAI